MKRYRIVADNMDVAESRTGNWAEWQDVATLLVRASALIAKIEVANDLHAVFTIKDSAEFQDMKVSVSELMR